jgi:membrane protease YdiL (CAAX protease family)
MFPPLLRRAGPSGALLDARQKALLAVLCVAAGILALSMRYIPGNVTRIIWGLAVAALFMALTLVARQRPALRHYWELPFAFFVLALFVVLDNTLPQYVATSLLHTPPVTGDPLASKVGGTVIVQLVEVAITFALVVGLTKASGGSLSAISLRWGSASRALAIGIAGFVFFYILFLLFPGGSKFIPMHGGLTRQTYLALTPALLAIVLCNGFLEELVFRGLFLRKYTAFLGPVLANVTQAAIFALAHVGISYTPFALLFIALIVFPLGVLFGYLMRSSNGIIASTLFHAGADIPIYQNQG